MMANAAGMLVSTLDDFWAFVSMLLANGEHEGRQVLSPASVAAMTRNHLTAQQRASARLFLGEHGGWGYGMATPGPITTDPPVPWGIGWTGGTGTLWCERSRAPPHRHPFHPARHDLAPARVRLHRLPECRIRGHGRMRYSPAPP